MRNKRILLGITGGIAAYKIAFLIRLLKKRGAEVKCIMTPASCDFISPLVVSTLSKNPVGIEFWNKKDGTWNNHVDYGLWADVMVIAPCTANTIAKMATGSCDNLLLATYLSMKGKTMIAPAMDLDMFAHPSTKRNLETLVKDGVIVLPTESGELASGLVGEGRMLEPESIVDRIEDFLKRDLQQHLSGKKVLMTTGPTYEAIDPVRFIGNHSSGKMGYAIAEEFLLKGAHVILVSGPTKLLLEHPNLELIKVESARQMLDAVQNVWDQCDCGIFTAAVADYRPKTSADQKIKRESSGDISIDLVQNPDILKWAGENKQPTQILVGFALETNDEEAHAKAKLEKKNLDFIILNSLNDSGAGFAVDTNKISIIDRHNKLTKFELKSKPEVAQDIVEYLISYKK